MEDKGGIPEVEGRSAVDYMLRTAQQNFTQLSIAADQKANILVGSTIIMVPLVLGSFGSSEYTWTLTALAALTLPACGIALLGIIPRMPRATSGTRFSEGYNPLFFTQIHRLTEHDYQQLMHEVMSEDRLLYQSIVRDLYRHGLVLQRKYRYLRLAYMVFFAGLLVAFTVLISESQGYLL
ncbi:MAG: DUF5706 domain-containing protein [Gammaproteobacteria bacterium]|nr:DUF5706 domain-containing protein [Gammaproteobacteria bacterium]